MKSKLIGQKLWTPTRTRPTRSSRPSPDQNLTDRLHSDSPSTCSSTSPPRRHLFDSSMSNHFYLYVPVIGQFALHTSSTSTAFGLSTSCQQMLHFYQIVIYPCDKGKSNAFSSFHSGQVRSIPTLYSHDSSINLSSSNHNPNHTSSWTRSTPRCSSCSCLFGFTTEGKSSTTPLSVIGLHSMSS